MSTTPEALAAKLEAASRDRWAFGLDLAGAAAELRRLAAVEAERDGLVAAIGNQQLAYFIKKHGDPVPIVAERDQLRAEVEALRADAERYRWLCSLPMAVAPPSLWEEGIGFLCGVPVPRGTYRTKADIDAAIDEARKG